MDVHMEDTQHMGRDRLSVKITARSDYRRTVTDICIYTWSM